MLELQKTVGSKWAYSSYYAGLFNNAVDRHYTLHIWI